jgi:signal transduction histidine kinase
VSDSIRLQPSITASVRAALHPPVRDRRFWIVQGAVLLTFLLHEMADGRLGLPVFPEVPHQATLIIFALPIIYATLVYGMSGAAATSAFVILLCIIDVLQEISGAPDLRGDIAITFLEVGMFCVIAVVVGQRVEAERRARRQAELAEERTSLYAANVLKAQEEERRRISRELHDQPVQTLVHLCRKLDNARSAKDSPEAADRELSEARTIAQETIESLRVIAKGLRPPALDDLGLVSCVRSLLSSFGSRTGLHATFVVKGTESRLPPEIELTLFRIGQEALSNVERHADAGNVSVEVVFGRQNVSLTVRDDGRGFTRSAIAANPGSLGILGMHERAELQGGQVDVKSAPRQGTAVTVKVPRTLALASDHP